MSKYSILGKNLPRKDAIEKVNGEAKFVADIRLPRMLYASFLRSPHAHARIVSIDTSQAEALPGVKCVLTHKDVPKVHPRKKMRYLLDETMHAAGEEVAAVAAVTKEIADEAAKLIEVEYEVLPAVFDAEEAMKPDAPLVYPEHGTNMYHGTVLQPAPNIQADGWMQLQDGDLEKGFAEADYILEEVYETPTQYHCSPMPRSVVCQWTGDKLTCWACSQKPMLTMQDLANCLGIAQSSVRVITTYVVGGYGGKEPEEIAVITAILAKRTGRPVKAVLTRAEDFIATRHRSKYKAYEKIGVKKDGTITAMDHRMIHNFGKDNNLAFLVVAVSALYTCMMLYPYSASRFRGCSILTNITEHGSMNGMGSTEAVFCVERLIDEAAEKIDMDPVKFRLKNCLRYGTRAQERNNILGARTHGIATTGRRTALDELEWGIVGTDADSLIECIRKVTAEAQWEQKWKGWKTPVEVNGPKRKGIGISLGINGSLYMPYSATVKMNHDGTASVMSSATEIGQGCATAMAQVVAEALGLRYEDVSVLMADTIATPAGTGNIGSCGTSSAIAAAKHAADDARHKIFALASQMLGVKPDDLEAKDRKIYTKNDSSKEISIAEVCFVGYQIMGFAINPPQSSIRDEKTGKIIYDCSYAATIAEVEVDTDTGQLDVLRLTSGHDCGVMINPDVIRNQVDLGIIQGNGWVRSEDLVIDNSTGVVINPNLLDYKLMTILDMPKNDDIKEFFVEYPCAWGPFGAKGMSETSTTSQAASLANAVYNAIGVRIRGDHLTPDIILAALEKLRRGD